MAPLPDRISSIDLIRGFAVLGMIFINMMVYIPNFHDILYKNSLDGKIISEASIYEIIFILFDGKMRALFGILFGAGILLFFRSGSKELINKSDLFSRRMFWLLIFGLLHAYILLWPGSILLEYAICGLLLFTFRDLSARVLLILSFLVLGYYIFINSKDYYTNYENYKGYKKALVLNSSNKPVSLEIEKKKRSFENYLQNFPPFDSVMIEKYDSEKRAKVQLYTSDLSKIYFSNIDKSTESLSIGVYTYILESIGTMLLGMSLLKYGFFEDDLNKRFYTLFILLGFPVAIIMYYFLFQWRVATKNELIEIFDWNIFSSESIETIARLILAVGYCSLLISCSRLRFFKGIIGLIINVGRTAFTNYIIQTIICTLVFYLLKYYGCFNMFQFLFFGITVVIIQLALGYFFIKYMGTGPLESLWRKLTEKGLYLVRARKNI